MPTKKGYNLINQLRSGYSKLKAYQKYINQHIDSENCATCNSKEDTEHFIMHCEKYDTER